MRKSTEEEIQGLNERRSQLVESLGSKPSGLHWCTKNTQIANEIALAIYDDLLSESDDEPNLAIIATGGFGRGELCPKSDIDITIVPGDDASAQLDPVIRRLFQDIHWAYCTVLRLDVGYAYRLISDAPGLDAKTRTGLLDMRLLAGSGSIFRQLQDTLAANFPAGEFVMAKIQERREMFERYNDTPLVVEPQLKEGAGGLRDFHAASWIGEAIGERAARPTAAYDSIMKYRNLLHFCAKKGQDTLSRSRQIEIAKILDIQTSQIVAEVTEAGEELHSTYRRATEKLFEARFTLVPGVVSVAGEVRILADSTAGTAAVGVAIATHLGLRVSDLPSKASNPYGGPPAAFALAKGEKTIRNLDRCTLLEQLAPELTRCRYLAGDENAHTFTVMEHSLRVVRNLDELTGPDYLNEVKGSITDLEPLYLAAVFHDAGKAIPTGDHSREGARIMEEVGYRWDLSPSTIDVASWLVREHLTMSRYIRIRDLAHPSTIAEFAGIVQDPERLKMLTLLTWADINAVSPGASSPAQEIFLKQLFDRTMMRFQGDAPAPVDASQSRQRLLRQLAKKPEETEEVQRFLESLPAYYLTSTNAELIRLHMALAEHAKQGELTIEQFPRPDLGATEITICAADSPGLLRQILGVLYAQDLTVVGIRACTTSGPSPVAIDVFTVNFGGRMVPHATMAKTASLLKEVILGTSDLDSLLSAKEKDPNRRQQITKWSYVPGVPGILELVTPRGRGMAFRLSRMFSQKGWNIHAARVGQWAGNAAAAFYLTSAGGEELTSEIVAEIMSKCG